MHHEWWQSIDPSQDPYSYITSRRDDEDEDFKSEGLRCAQTIHFNFDWPGEFRTVDQPFQGQFALEEHAYHGPIYVSEDILLAELERRMMNEERNNVRCEVQVDDHARLALLDALAHVLSHLLLARAIVHQHG